MLQKVNVSELIKFALEQFFSLYSAKISIFL